MTMPGAPQGELAPAVLRQLWDEDARQSLSWFMEYTSRGRWKPARHLDAVCERLEAVESGRCRRLILALPPRHGKSEIASRGFPAWVLGRNPEREILLASYSAELAFDFSRMARALLRDWGPRLWGVRLAHDSSSVGRWGIDGHRGGLVAAGVGGPFTGRGADVLIIDDPIKNADEAASDIIRQRQWEWYRTTARTRLAPGGAIVVIQTRWHEDDLTGRLLADAAAGGEQWEVLSLPAMADEDDPLGRSVGDPLWPARFPLPELEAVKRAVGSRVWAALYQQRPSPEEGGIIKRAWWRFYDTPPADFEQMLISWDLAFKNVESSSGNPDYVVGQVWGRRGADCYLLDQERGRWDFVETVAVVERLAARWPEARPVLIEDAANGPAVIASLRRKLGAILPVKPEGGKVARVNAISPWLESGNVYLPAPATHPWVQELIEEAAAFPNGRHDDQVDSMSQALIRLVGRAGGGGSIVPGGLPGRGRETGEDDDDDRDMPVGPTFWNT